METARPVLQLSRRIERSATGNTVPAAFFIALYLIVVLSPFAFVLAYGPETSQPLVHEVGKAFALSGFAIIAMQFVLSSRAKWMEHPYGLDMVYRFHKRMAVFGAALLVSHPILLSIGFGNASLLTSTDVPGRIWLGRTALALIVAQVVISVFRVRLRIRFEHWRWTHNLLALSLIGVAFEHGLDTSIHDLRLAPVRALWFVLLGTALAFYSWRKIISPFLLRRHPYRIVDAHRETHDVWTLSFRPAEGMRRYRYLPGQFQFITFSPSPEIPRQEHPFSITSSPLQGETVSTSIKESGDFTSLVGKTRVGGTAVIDAPYGRFSYLLHPEDTDIVFIAGGIGITPIMSMLRHMRDSGYEHTITLIYANRSERDIAFRGELAKMEAQGNPDIRVIHVIENPSSGWKGGRGLITRTVIERHVAHYHIRPFYICGPVPLLNAVYRILHDLGVPDGNIRSERFSL